jgi:flagellar capping protein FliD
MRSTMPRTSSACRPSMMTDRRGHRPFDRQLRFLHPKDPHRFHSLFTDKRIGFGSTDTYTLLSQIGIESDPDNEGTWTIDSTALRDALNENPEAVANLFINNTSRGTSGVAKLMYDEMKTQTDDETGMGPILVSNYNDIIDNINSKIEYEENRIALYEERQTLQLCPAGGHTWPSSTHMQNSIESQIAPDAE